jgi:uncharacterized protein with PIN domain
VVSLERVLAICEARGVDVEWMPHYCEPGYECSDRGIVLADWNDRKTWENGVWTTLDDAPSRLAEIFEHLGYEIEWSDEWTRCDDCDGAVRVAPDSHDWVPSYVLLMAAVDS